MREAHNYVFQVALNAKESEIVSLFLALSLQVRIKNTRKMCFCQ